MAEPLDAVKAIHNAFRRDLAGIDAAALGLARGKSEFAPAVERFRFFNEALVWHAHGEELAIFPALEAVVPSVAEAYERDHRGLDAAFDALSAAVSADDALETARAHARPGQGSRYHGKHRATRPFPGAGRGDVSLDEPRRPREHDPYLANGDAASSIRASQAAHPGGDRQRLGRADTANPYAGIRCNRKALHSVGDRARGIAQ